MTPGLTPSDFNHWVSRGGAILIDRGEWPILSCHLMHIPSDAEVIAYLEQCERALGHRKRYAMLLTRMPQYVEAVEHAALREAWERVNAGKLGRYCAGTAIVVGSHGAVRASSMSMRDGVVPTRLFSDDVRARQWLLARLRHTPS